MKKIFFTLLFLFSAATVHQSYGQMPKRPTKKVYISTDFDIFLLSSSLMDNATERNKITVPRFTAIPFLGFNVNFDFGKTAGLYTGLNIKNIGFIEKFSQPDSTVKRRVYTIGVPLGLKIGDIKYGSYLILGGGVDFPFHYKEKGYTSRGNKTKINEWFSDRTPRIMPYVFVGAHLAPALAFKLQYYPTNFMNTNYKVPAKGSLFAYPYSAYSVSTVLLTVGIDIPYSPKD